MFIDDLLKIAIEMDASDLHLKVGSLPQVRVNGRLIPLERLPRLTVEDTENLSAEIMGEAQKARFQEEFDLDLAYSLPGFGRFRGSIFLQRSSIAIAVRVIPFEVKPFKELLLPDVIEKICAIERGLVLVTGSTGSGKTTTLASIISSRSKTRLNTSTGTKKARSASGKSVGTSNRSPAASGRPSARTPTSFWSGKCGTRKRSRRP
jgi:twitching motility protein PilT